MHIRSLFLLILLLTIQVSAYNISDSNVGIVSGETLQNEEYTLSVNLYPLQSNQSNLDVGYLAIEEEEEQEIEDGVTVAGGSGAPTTILESTRTSIQGITIALLFLITIVLFILMIAKKREEEKKKKKEEEEKSVMDFLP